MIKNRTKFKNCSVSGFTSDYTCKSCLGSITKPSTSFGSTFSFSTILFIVSLFIVTQTSCGSGSTDNESICKKSFSVENNQITIYSSMISDTINMLLLSDTHLFMKDSRENPYEQYSKRMSEAYNITKHYKTGEETTPSKVFNETVSIAREKKVDLLAMLGDIFSYPSEYAIEWVDSTLHESGLNYVYTSGNHDWHYEGMTGSSNDLRQTWINERLLPLYKGHNPLCYSVDVKGIRVLVIDNSTYEITDEQLAFFQEQAKTNLPLLLMMHIPIYMPGRGVGYGCGHPNWNKENDHGYNLERREPWSENGHTSTTLQFRDEVLNTPNLLAVFSGHIHQQTLDVSCNNLPLFVGKENASGNYYNVRILPME